MDRLWVHRVSRLPTVWDVEAVRAQPNEASEGHAVQPPPRDLLEHFFVSEDEERERPPAGAAPPQPISAAADALPGGSERASAGTDEAEREYRLADELGDAAGAFNVAALLHRRGDLAGAMAAYRRAEQRGDPDAAFNLGVLLYESGDLDEAEAAWRRAVERQHAKAATNLGFLLRRRGDLDGARAAYCDAGRWGDPVGASMATELPGDITESEDTSPP